MNDSDCRKEFESQIAIFEKSNTSQIGITH